MNYKIIDIFPTAVMKFKLDRQISKEELEFVNKEESNSIENAGNHYSKNTFILNESEMSSINNFCNEALQTYFQKIINPFTKTNIRITQSWLNYTNKKQFHHEHNHPNSILSGVFYFSADENKDVICFRKEEYKQVQLLFKEANDYNTYQTDVKIQTGDLVLFPSNILHFVPQVETSKTRISLAFNSFISGEIGVPEALNYVKI